MNEKTATSTSTVCRAMFDDLPPLVGSHLIGLSVHFVFDTFGHLITEDGLTFTFQPTKMSLENSVFEVTFTKRFEFPVSEEFAEQECNNMNLRFNSAYGAFVKKLLPNCVQDGPSDHTETVFQQGFEHAVCEPKT